MAGAPPAPLAYVLLAVGGASLIARRRYPVGVLAVVLVTTLWASGESAHVIYLALIVAFFNAVLARKRAAAIASLVIGYAASVWPWLIGQQRPRLCRVRARAGGRADVPAERRRADPHLESAGRRAAAEPGRRSFAGGPARSG